MLIAHSNNLKNIIKNVFKYILRDVECRLLVNFKNISNEINAEYKATLKSGGYKYELNFRKNENKNKTKITEEIFGLQQLLT